MPHQRLHQLAQPRILARAERGDDLIEQGLLASRLLVGHLAHHDGGVAGLGQVCRRVGGWVGRGAALAARLSKPSRHSR